MSKSIWYIILIIVVVLILIFAFRGDSVTDTEVDTSAGDTEMMDDTTVDVMVNHTTDDAMMDDTTVDVMVK